MTGMNIAVCSNEPLEKSLDTDYCFVDHKIHLRLKVKLYINKIPEQAYQIWYKIT